jgi:DNA replication protein DnaC
MEAQLASPEHRAHMARMAEEEEREKRRALERALASLMARFPEKSRQAAAHFGSAAGAARRSAAMTWALRARTLPAWASGASGVMFGPKGCGKTTACCALARLEVLDGRSVRYIKPARAKVLEDEQTLEVYQGADLVVLDQAHQMAEISPWFRTALKDLIDTRYEARRTMMILATVPEVELLAILGTENFDRTHPDLRWKADPREHSLRWTP